MKQPFVLVVEVFLFCQMVSVISIRKSIPSSTMIFVSMIFNHSNTECLIVVMDSLELSLLTFLFQLVSQIILFVLLASSHIDVDEGFPS